MKLFVKIVKTWKLLTVFAKKLDIMYVSGDSNYTLLAESFSCIVNKILEFLADNKIQINSRDKSRDASRTNFKKCI